MRVPSFVIALGVVVGGFIVGGILVAVPRGARGLGGRGRSFLAGPPTADLGLHPARVSREAAGGLRVRA